MTLANKITILRIILIPAVVIGLLAKAPVWPAALFLLSAMTDVLDGAVARWLRQRTTLGSFLDPLADKLLLVSTFLALVYTGRLPVWLFVLVFSRDLLIFLGWNIIYVLTKTFTVEPRWLGKSTTFLQMATVATALIEPLRGCFPWVMWAMVVATVFSTLDYVRLGARKLGQVG